MADLEKQIRESATILQKTWTELQFLSPPALPQECCELLKKRAELFRVLNGTIGIFPIRKKAWEIVQYVFNTSGDDCQRPNHVKYCMNDKGNDEVDFSVARHLSLTSYVTTTWSIYDRISNICGRIISVSEIANHRKLNPKINEDFLGEKDKMGFSVHKQIKHGYAWPIKVSYNVRNWLVHEGSKRGDVPLFLSDNIRDKFLLHGDAKAHIESECGYTKNEDGSSACCWLSANEEYWPTGDLIKILESYHGEIDTMFAALLQWSVESFSGQFRAFAR